MIKLLCFPLTKLVLFLSGYAGAISMARATSHTFNVIFGNTFNNQFRFGLPVGIILFTASIVLLFAAIYNTKPKEQRENIYRIWRNADAFLLLLSAGYIAFWSLSHAHTNWVELGAFFLPLLAYAVVILVIAELVARLRDKDLLRTLYWVRFFRVHPVWRPLGFLFAMMLIGSLLLLLIFVPGLARNLGFLPRFGITLIQPLANGRWFLDLLGICRVFSGVSFIALTYFAAVLLNLETRYAKANADQIRSERFKSELITNVSHDIRTPLTSIINYVDLLKTQPLDSTPAEYVAILEKKSDRLKVLIDDLMDASKAGTGNMKVELQAINLTELVGQIAGEFDEIFARQNLSLVLRAADEPITAQADSRHLWRALENLFANAAKYALAGTRAFAEIARQDDDVSFTLKNTSAAPIDLPDAMLAEQFIRGDRARESEGSGLGLYIAKSLVELMDGKLTIRTSGDLFEVEILIKNK